MSNKLTATDDLFVYLLSSIDVYGANSFIDISAYNHHGKDKGELLASQKLPRSSKRQVVFVRQSF